jgi:hypothetical protein
MQIQIPDTLGTGFEEECCRQSVVVAKADAADADIEAFMDAALADLEGTANGNGERRAL